MKELDKLWATTLEVIELAKRLPEGNPIRVNAERTYRIVKPAYDQLNEIEKNMSKAELEKEWNDPEILRWIADLQRGMESIKKDLQPKETLFKP